MESRFPPTGKRSRKPAGSAGVNAHTGERPQVPRLRSLGLRRSEPEGGSIALAMALVAHAAGKAAHQVDAEVADLGLLQRGRRHRRWKSGRVESLAGVLDLRAQRVALLLELDRDLGALLFGSAMHDDIGNRLLQAQLKGKSRIRRHALLGPALDPTGQSFELRQIVTQDQAAGFHECHRCPSRAFLVVVVRPSGCAISRAAYLRAPELS